MIYWQSVTYFFSYEIKLTNIDKQYNLLTNFRHNKNCTTMNKKVFPHSVQKFDKTSIFLNCTKKINRSSVQNWSTSFIVYQYRAVFQLKPTEFAWFPMSVRWGCGAISGRWAGAKLAVAAMQGMDATWRPGHRTRFSAPDNVGRLFRVKQIRWSCQWGVGWRGRLIRV